MDQLSVFDKEALKIFCSVAPYSFVTWTVGEMDQPMPKALDGHLSPSIYAIYYYLLYIFLYFVAVIFSRRCFKIETNGFDPKTQAVFLKDNERRAHQKTKPFFAAALCHTGNSSTLGSELLSATTTVAVTSPLLAGRVVTSSQSTWGRS